MGPYNEDQKVVDEQQDYFAPLLKLRWVKTKMQPIGNIIDPIIFFRLTVQIEYSNDFFIPLFVDSSSQKTRPDVQVSFLGKSIMITIGLITYSDYGIEMPVMPKTLPTMTLTKFSKFSFDFDCVFDRIEATSNLFLKLLLLDNGVANSCKSVSKYGTVGTWGCKQLQMSF